MSRTRSLLVEHWRKTPAGYAVRNKILSSIPEAEFQIIAPHLKFSYFSRRQTLHESNEELQFVYFLNSGLVTMMIETGDGKTVEVGAIGRDGVVGMPSVVGFNRSPLRELMQIAGDGFSIKVSALRTVLRSTPSFRTMLNQYAVLQGLQISQCAACNRLHSVEQRLIRWLLTAQDASESDSLVVTHDFLAAMLGTDRPSVSVAASNCQRKKTIAYTRGVIKILNRKKLERSMCECYAIIRGLVTQCEWNNEK